MASPVFQKFERTRDQRSCTTAYVSRGAVKSGWYIRHPFTCRGAAAVTSVPMPDIDANDVRHLTAVLEPPAEWGVGDDVPATTFEGVEPGLLLDELEKHERLTAWLVARGVARAWSAHEPPRRTARSRGRPRLRCRHGPPPQPGCAAATTHPAPPRRGAPGPRPAGHARAVRWLPGGSPPPSMPNSGPAS